jgi:AcrR family transcriptional regulator
MSEAAVLPRGNAVALSGEVQMVETGRSDGRNRRAAETRRKIIAAAKEMIAETSTAPTVVAVAKRADVSVRSVFQHFGDVESLFVTVVDSVRGDLVVPPPTSSSRPLSDRIASVVDNLAQVFDKIVPLRVAAGQFVNHPALTERGLVAKNEVRQATFEVFAPEFAMLGEPAREELADARHVLAVTFTNKTAGATFYIAWLQDGTGGRTINYGASATNACQPDATAGATTTQAFQVSADGTTVNGIGCPSTTALESGPEQAAPGTPPVSTWVRWADSTNHVLSYKANGSSTVSNTVVPNAGASNQFVASIGANGVVVTAQPAFSNLSGAATTSQLPTVTLRRVCDIGVGDTSGSAITDAQLGPQKHACKIPAAATLVEIDVESDAASPSIVLGRRRCTTFTAGVCSAETKVDILSSALAVASGFGACSKTTAVTGLDGGTTCSATLQNTALLAGDWVELVSGTAGGTAKWMTVHAIYTID